jgi:hypothetical protein
MMVRHISDEDCVMRMFSAALCVAVIAAAGQLARAETPPAGKETAAATSGGKALSPAVQAAIADLSSEDYKTREGALRRLQVAMGEQMRALVSSEDPEVQSRLISLLQFNEGMTRWIIDTYKLPAAERQAQLNFGLKAEMIPVLALAFSSEGEKRVEGIRELGKIEGPEATALLGRMLNDPDRAVYVAAMEAVWDRKPTQQIVDALWDRAVDAGFAVYGAAGARMVAQNIKFRGRPIAGTTYMDTSYVRRQQDAGIACEVLVNVKAPEVVEKLKGFLANYEKAMDGTNPNANFWMYNSNTESMKNVYKLIDAYKSKEVLGALYKIATAPVRQRSQGAANRDKYFWSNRTTALATLVAGTDQKHEDYSLKRQTVAGGMWTTPTEADEDAAVKKMQEWWAANGEKLTEKAPGATKEAAGSQPAKKVEKPEAAVVPAGNGVIIHNVQAGGGAIGEVQVRVRIGPAPIQVDE